MSDALEIICWPDPRLKKVSRPVETFDEKLALLTVKMFELMRESRGVGLAAPQVGKNIRLFVMNHNGEPGSDRIYVNPVLSDADGDEEAEEGCLSLPKVNVMVVRSKAMRMTAMDLHGKPFEQIAKDTDRDFFMSAAESRDYGLVDEVVKSRRDIDKKPEKEKTS